MSDKAEFFEIKRQKEEISINVLKQRAEAFLRATYEFRGYSFFYIGLSMSDL